MTRVALALGTNLGSRAGDRAATLVSAVRGLVASGDLRLVAVSPTYETEPVGGPDQPAYLNAVLLADTDLTPERVLDLAQAVEADHERERTVRWGPRTLDVDVLQYGDPRDGTDVRLDGERLTLPHPRAHERAFVLVPWAAADPEALLRLASGAVARVADLAGRAADRDNVRRSAPLDLAAPAPGGQR